MSRYARHRGASKYPGLWKGMIGAWEPPLLGPTGLKIFDASGRKNKGTFANGPTMVMTERGWAINYAAGTEYVQINALAGPFNTVRGTLMLWANLRAMSANGILFEARVISDSHQVSMEWIDADSQLRFLYFEGTINEVRTSTIAEGNGWHHLAITWDTDISTMKAYVDGIFEGEDTTIPGTMSAAPDLVSFGGNSSGTGTIDGMIGSVRPYDRVLTPNEIRQSYEIDLAPFVLRSRPLAKAPVAVTAKPAIYYQQMATGAA